MGSGSSTEDSRRAAGRGGGGDSGATGSAARGTAANGGLRPIWRGRRPWAGVAVGEVPHGISREPPGRNRFVARGFKSGNDADGPRHRNSSCRALERAPSRAASANQYRHREEICGFRASWPKTPTMLGNELSRLSPQLRERGIFITFGRHKKSRWITIATRDDRLQTS